MSRRYTAAVITVSDKGYRGEREDTSGPALCALLRERGYEILHTAIVPDEVEEIRGALLDCADSCRAALILTTGGTGFSPRDITPEATRSVLERETPGLPEVMRAESMKITPRGCLSRGIAGIRGRSLIINLPGSKKASAENLLAVLDAAEHGLDMLFTEGSADCAERGVSETAPLSSGGKIPPSMDAWIREAKADPLSKKCGMYLFHNGVVRESARASVRDGAKSSPVAGMAFSYDEGAVEAAVQKARQMPGIFHARVWLNEGHLQVGDDIMYVLVGGDIRPRVLDALQALVGDIKQNCVTEREIMAREGENGSETRKKARESRKR